MKYEQTFECIICPSPLILVLKLSKYITCLVTKGSVQATVKSYKQGENAGTGHSGERSGRVLSNILWVALHTCYPTYMYKSKLKSLQFKNDVFGIQTKFSQVLEEHVKISIIKNMVGKWHLTSS